MTRQHTLVAGLVVVLVVAAWWFLLMAPRSEEVATLRDEATDVRGQQAVTQQRIRALESVRTEAPDIEAELAAARQVLPDTPGLPAAVRQLQDAADQSGVVLANIAPSRPAAVGDVPGLTEIDVALTVDGGFYQWVDFLRRVEDPRLVGRGVMVDAIDLGVGEYPSLTGSVQLTMFATTEVVSPGLADEAAAADAASGGEADDAEEDA